MSNHHKWLNRPMSATASVDTAAGMARYLEDRIAGQRGIALTDARIIVARETEIAPGTLANLRRDPPRLKSISSWIETRLAALLCREIEAEIARLSHDLQIARRVAVRPDEAAIGEAEAALAAARSAIERLKA